MARCMDCLEYANGYCYYFQLYLSQLDYPYDDEDARNCPGFNGKSSDGGCFLTSALVHYLGKKDDCEELTLLRSFRDNYMRSFEEGKKLVDEYYVVAPKIVSAIEASDKKEEYYSDINNTVNACVKNIKEGKNDETMALYVGMVNKYKALAL